ncbi:MAG: hypothetical protein B7Y25_08105 [Alphaproteobacteria bacterium 16-39-46]|nr:MAG: hypothetical protein B7Y25_08105 [Alphaproteobacteria bacterium 16-39-46]OZA41298.1 MAG: hypothetical protein B7X84_08225 [Alphaproteobacteria bacterium 17-39-52]HQS84844.1 hypothetical protein [Alphaproteobacteria bacterium]HQS94632.1 hypothetical protein [Alphaproteobacteria bacterium]
MKYSFLNKPSFLALCALLMLPSYLPAMEEGDKGGKPGKAAPSAVGGAGVENDLPPAYAAVVTVAAAGDSSKAEKSDDEEDGEVGELMARLRAQEDATKQATERAERAQVLAAKKASLLQRIEQLKQEEEKATQAAIGALEGRIQAAPAAEEGDEEEIQRLGAPIDARREAIQNLEDEVAGVNAELSGTASGRTHAQEKRWTNFSKEWTETKTARQAEGRKGLSDAQKVEKETQRVVNQVRDFGDKLGKKLFGKKKKR